VSWRSLLVAFLYSVQPIDPVAELEFAGSCKFVIACGLSYVSLAAWKVNFNLGSTKGLEEECVDTVGTSVVVTPAKEGQW
jgi:hypothetical protein